MSGYAKRSNSYARDMHPCRGPGKCIHCGTWTKRYYGRKLCWQCRRQPQIVERYPVLPGSRGPSRKTTTENEIELWPDEGPDKPRLPLMTAKDWLARDFIPRCVHDLLDGTCAVCERQQRAELGIVQEEVSDA